jgi:hypothetical protein
MINFGFVENYVKEHTAELMREADTARLVDQAVGRGRPVRLVLANCLRAVAARIDGTPRQPVVRARA